MSKYFFDSDKDRECVVKFTNTTKEEAKVYRLENNNLEFKQQILDDHKALYSLSAIIVAMILDCRKHKQITLDEEDCEFLYKMASKQVEIDYFK